MNLGLTGNRSAYLRGATLAITAFLLSLTFLNLPRQPYLIDDSLSEKAVLSYAREHRLQFGTDIVFTYGPAGFLTSRHFFPQGARLRMAVDLLLAFAVSTGICLIAWKLRTFWKYLLLSLFTFLAANIDPRADLLIYIGVFSWALLCMFGNNASLPFYLLGFILLAAFGVLVKGNFLVVAGGSAAVVAIDLLLRRCYKAAASLVLGLSAAFVIGWLALGQSPSHLAPFLRKSIWIIQGYDQAVGLEGIVTFKSRGLLLMLFALAAIIICALKSHSPDDQRSSNWRKAILLMWLAGLLFVIWKHAFVRADLYHLGFWFGFVPILALAINILPIPNSKARIWLCGCSLACCCIAVITLESLFFSSIGSSLIQPFAGFRQNVRALLAPDKYEREMMEPYTVARQATALPKISHLIGGSSIDVFGQDQCYAVFNGWNYHPRPAFQSYMAYNAPLIKLNDEFYHSTSAPEYVLFGLNPVDRKFPSLEDSHVLRHLLLNYEMVTSEGKFVLLKSSAQRVAHLRLLREGDARIGELIQLKEFMDDLLWMEIEIKPNVLGHLRQWFYKPAKLRLATWVDPAGKSFARSGAPAPMLAAGFLVNPLLLNTQDVKNFYSHRPNQVGPVSPSGPPELANKEASMAAHAAACAVQAEAGGERFWKQDIHFRIFKVETNMSALAPSSTNLQSPLQSRPSPGI